MKFLHVKGVTESYEFEISFYVKNVVRGGGGN